MRNWIQQATSRPRFVCTSHWTLRKRGCILCSLLGNVRVTSWLPFWACQTPWALAGRSMEFRIQNLALFPTASSKNWDALKITEIVKRANLWISGDCSVVPEPRSFIYISIELILSLFIASLLCNCPTQLRFFFGVRCGIVQIPMKSSVYSALFPFPAWALQSVLEILFAYSLDDRLGHSLIFFSPGGILPTMANIYQPFARNCPTVSFGKL